MTLQQLRYALTIAGCGSMNEAAKRLFLSQPSLSETVKAVSYTHLDVYKRQGVQSISSERLLILSKGTGTTGGALSEWRIL